MRKAKSSRRKGKATVDRPASELSFIKRIREHSGAPAQWPPILEALLMTLRVPPTSLGETRAADGSLISGPEDQREFARQAVAWASRQFKETRNPLHVWKAYTECRGASLPVPNWVLRYFDDVARKLLRFATDPETVAPWQIAPEATQGAVLTVLGLNKRGRGSVFTTFDRTAEMLLGERVHWHMKGGTKLDFAYDEVSRERKVSRSTVRRAWKKHCGLFGVSTKRPTF